MKCTVLDLGTTAPRWHKKRGWQASTFEPWARTITLRHQEDTMINTIRRKLIERLAGAPIIEDLDVEESIYPLTMSGTIAVRNLEGDVDIYDGTAVINADTSLTIAAGGNIIAYYPASAYEAVAPL